VTIPTSEGGGGNDGTSATGAAATGTFEIINGIDSVVFLGDARIETKDDLETAPILEIATLPPADLDALAALPAGTY
jgi:hypothetical protein